MKWPNTDLSFLGQDSEDRGLPLKSLYEDRKIPPNMPPKYVAVVIDTLRHTVIYWMAQHFIALDR